MKHLYEYEDEEIKGLIGDLRGVGHGLTEEEEDMKDFINQFGGGMDPEEYAETLFDYYNHPEEYDIDESGDYYDMIWYLYDNSVSDFARFNLSGPMSSGNYDRWNIEGIKNNEIYQLYLRMSK
jgi:hypothetical protein